MPNEVVQCKACGRNTTNTGTCFCDNCWEIDHRLDLLNNQAIDFFMAILEKMRKQA